MRFVDNYRKDYKYSVKTQSCLCVPWTHLVHILYPDHSDECNTSAVRLPVD